MPRKGWSPSADLGMVDIDVIEIPPWARKLPRDYLEESIQERGVIEPILIAAVPNGSGKRNKYILIDGHGRLELARKRGDKKIPARIVKLNSEEEALLLAIELEQTRAPWSLEYTLSIIQELLSRGYSKTKIAEILKVPRSKIYRYLWILEFPEEVRKAFIEGKLPIRAADTIKSTINLIKEKRPDLETQFWEELGWQPEYYVKVCNRYYSLCSEEFEEEEEEKEEEGEKEIPAEEEFEPVGFVRLEPVDKEEKGVPEEEKEEAPEGKGKLLTLSQVEEMVRQKIAPAVSKKVAGQDIQEFEEEIQEYREEIQERKKEEKEEEWVAEFYDAEVLRNYLKQFNSWEVVDFDADAHFLIIYLKVKKNGVNDIVELKVSRSIAKYIIQNGLLSLF